MTIREINLINPPDHINQFLTHWTGRKKDAATSFDILCKIIETMELKFSPNRISDPRTPWKTTQQMISFTDTPIAQSYKHCQRYNYFGVSFNKNQMIEYGASPVLYVLENRRRHQEYIQQILNTIAFPDNESQALLSWYNSIGQPYDTQNLSEFTEREWRVVRQLPFTSIKMQEEARGKFNEYPFKGELRRNGILSKPDDDEFFLKFPKNIIENIVVPQDYRDKANELIEHNKLDCELVVIK